MPKRQHPIFIIYLLGKWFKGNLLGILFVLFWNGSFITYIGIAMLVLSLLVSLGKWYSTTYQVENGGIHIFSGIFSKEKTFIHREKVQTIRTQTPLLFRLFGFTSLYIETAGGDNEPEVSIQGIREREAQEIIRLMNQVTAFNEKEETIIFSFSKMELVLGASTSWKFVVVLLALLFAYDEFSDVIPKEWTDYLMSLVNSFSYQTWIFVILLLLVISLILSIFLFGYKYVNYKVKKEEDGVRIFQGLLEKKEFFIKHHRIQSITIKENVLRKALGYCTVSVEVTGGMEEEVGELKTLFPFIKKSRVKEIFSLYFPDYDDSLQLHGVGKEAQGFYYRRGLILGTIIPAVAIIGVSWYFHLPLLLWMIAVLPIVGFFIGRRKVMHTKYGITDKQLIFSIVSPFTFQTIFVNRSYIQMLTYEQTIFQRRKAVSSIAVAIAASASYTLAHIDKSGREDILAWFQKKKVTNAREI